MFEGSEPALEPVSPARIEVLPAEPQRRIWPVVGTALVWAARELLPEILAAWQASHVRITQPVSRLPDATPPLVSAAPHGHRFRRGRA